MIARRWSRLLVAVALFDTLLLSARLTTVLAQMPRGMTVPGVDMSGAPADVQAIWKKIMSGGTPTQAEAKRLSDWMEANKDKLVAASIAQSKAATQKMAAASGLTAVGADLPACPAKVTLPATLSVDPTDAAAAALLDSVRRIYTAQLTAASSKPVLSLVASTTDPAQLNLIGGSLFLKGFVAPAILAYVAEVSHATPVRLQSAWGDLGAALTGGGDPLHGVRAMRRTLLVGARSAPYVTTLGVAYADLGDLHTATTLLTEATHMSGTWGPAWDALGRVESCSGNMVAAAHAIEQAQDVDWDSSRDDDTKPGHGSPADPQNSRDEDDATKASKPFPVPPGPSAFPPPPGGQGNAGYFEAWQPKLGATWREQLMYVKYDVEMANAFRDIERQILSAPSPHDVSSPPGGPSRGMTIVFSISNGDQASRAVQVVEDRAAAKMNMIVKGWAYKDSLILQSALARAEPIEVKKVVCDRTAKLAEEAKQCYNPWCAAMNALADEEYGQRRGTAATLIGGLAGLSKTYSDAMNRWFDWAGEPGSRRTIDRSRRSRLAILETMAYTVAGDVEISVPAGCALKPANSSRNAKADADAERDAGDCKARSIHISHFATMDADCHAMKMTVEYYDKFGTPTLDIQRASSTKNGKFFIGVSGDKAGGLLSGQVGLQVTWDQGGWVQSSGLSASGGAGVDGLAHLSGDLALGAGNNGSLSGGASASVPAFGFAPGVSFGGK
jgi:hypothetical protein